MCSHLGLLYYAQDCSAILRLRMYSEELRHGLPPRALKLRFSYPFSPYPAFFVLPCPCALVLVEEVSTPVRLAAVCSEIQAIVVATITEHDDGANPRLGGW